LVLNQVKHSERLDRGSSWKLVSSLIAEVEEHFSDVWAWEQPSSLIGILQSDTVTAVVYTGTLPHSSLSCPGSFLEETYEKFSSATSDDLDRDSGT
jgi:hypothetical protein